MIHGWIDDMRQFKPRPLNLDAVAAHSAPGWCGGGMVECTPLAAADLEASTRLAEFLTAAQQEQTSLRDIALASADDYEQRDTNGKTVLEQVRERAPLTGPAPVFTDPQARYDATERHNARLLRNAEVPQ